MTTPEPNEANLDRVLSKVRGLIAKAESLAEMADKPGLGPTEASAYRAEADACRTMADALMLKYAIDDVGRAAEPGLARPKPLMIRVIVGQNDDIVGYVGDMLSALAGHCRCKVRMYDKYIRPDGWTCKVYGYESDVRYFELLYTTVRLHMLGVLIPRIDRRKTLDENCYLLHNAGYNWLEIAVMYGWVKYTGYSSNSHGGTLPPAGLKVPYWAEDEGWKPSTYVGGIYKRAYYRACDARNEQPQKIAANGTATYRKSAANGYVAEIRRRLWLMAKNRPAGADVVLASRADDIDALFKEDNPDLFPTEEELEAARKAAAEAPRGRTRAYRPAPVNEAAYRRGSAHAQSADLMGQARTGSGRAGTLPSGS